MEARKKAISREAAKQSTLAFGQHFFELRDGSPFQTGPHHEVLGEVLDMVLSGEITRLIVTMPPGYTKTELAVVSFMAKGFQVNAGSRFIHATFSDDLARENSTKVQNLMQLGEYQLMAPHARISKEKDASDRWKTTAEGGVLAKAAGGPITGFRAGRMDKNRFTGALIIDDPLKPDDAISPAKREAVNRRATNTFRSRLAHEGVPIIVIMQRLHTDDFAGHLLRGGSGDYWHHLELAVWLDSNVSYPKEWTHGVPIQHGLPDGPLWEEKHNAEEIEVLKVDAYTFGSQYQQRPVSIEGALFNMDGFRSYKELPPIQYFTMFADTAQKTAERNDYSVVQLWGKGLGSNRSYLVDQIRGKWTAPQLERNVKAFWVKHLDKRVRRLNVEDKVSGTGLIQSLTGQLPVRGIQRDRDKYTRGLDAAPWIEAGLVHLPEEAPWLHELRLELQNFDGLGTGFDDQVDPLMDAIAEFHGKWGYDGSMDWLDNEQ